MSEENSEPEIYKLKNPVRIITATALFDGHDVAINIFRRMLQSSGAEIIHLGHDRSAEDIVGAALQEDVQAIAVSSYQGGHIEFFKYIIDLLKQRNSSHIKVFGGGGGVIIPGEIRELEKYGVEKIFTPEHGQTFGLQGIANEILKRIDHDRSKKEISKMSLKSIQQAARMLDDSHTKTGTTKQKTVQQARLLPFQNLALALTALENGHLTLTQGPSRVSSWNIDQLVKESHASVIGFTGPGGAGKSTLFDELVTRFSRYLPEKKIAIFCIDPTKRKTGGALLGDRIRMCSLSNSNVFLRSFATRKLGTEINTIIRDAILLSKAAGFDLIFIETSGIGQGDSQIVDIVDKSIYIMTSEYGSPLQLEKIDMIDYADAIIINKFDKNGSQDAIREVRKQYKRSHQIFTHDDDHADLPIFGAIASRFNDSGVNGFFAWLVKSLNFNIDLSDLNRSLESSTRSIISQDRVSYLRGISNTIREYKEKTKAQKELLFEKSALEKVSTLYQVSALDEKLKAVDARIENETKKLIEQYDECKGKFMADELCYTVRDKQICLSLVEKSISGSKIPKISVPNYDSSSSKYEFMRKENFSGYFPFTAGVFPLKRKWEEPKRQFAGEGPPEKTNKRFHYLTKNETAKRLSTAFDSPTLYGQDPDEKPDIFGKIGESGVSICTLDDMKKLYHGFDLTSEDTSVSMTINGPAPIMLAFFFNTAIDQNIEKFVAAKKRKATPDEIIKIQEETLRAVRGTVQADILKEDQAQNTCIFSLDFALRLMGDVQEYFVKKNIQNYYSISVSGYHIAEAGANPITQLAFTLANGFTYLEYFLSRGIPVDKFAPNLSFFFSNGMDPEYTVIGRVARRIWAIALREIYGGSERSQKLKYHIQTSGRSLHAQNMAFNDIRTTLQAITAIYDNCNSLHTNSFDEAITTPTEEAVRQAMAIQLIINKEFGLTVNENPLQGAFIVDYLTELVEEAVLKEFDVIDSRGGVLGAIETLYQRSKIQDESMNYERKKNSGEYPIVGVNTFLKHEKERTDLKQQMNLTRTTYKEKRMQIENLRRFQKKHQKDAKLALKDLKKTIISGGNSFEELMKVARVASLGQITKALFEVGGKYRRNV